MQDIALLVKSDREDCDTRVSICNPTSQLTYTRELYPELETECGPGRKIEKLVLKWLALRPSFKRLKIREKNIILSRNIVE